MQTIRPFIAVALVMATFSTASFATAVHAGECVPRVIGGWVRSPPMPMPMMAGFGRIRNDCDHPVTVVGASSPAFADVSLHETRVVDGVSRMRAIPELVIAPGQSATLEPGGLHLMLMKPQAPPEAGSHVRIRFALKDGAVLDGSFEVRKPSQ
jgi:hypothetical protein